MLARVIGLAAPAALSYCWVMAVIGMSRVPTRETLAPILAVVAGAVTLFAAALLLAIASPGAAEAMFTDRLAAGALVLGAAAAGIRTAIAGPPVRSRVTDAVEDVLWVLGLTEKRPAAHVVPFTTDTARSARRING